MPPIQIHTTRCVLSYPDLGCYVLGWDGESTHHRLPLADSPARKRRGPLATSTARVVANRCATRRDETRRASWLAGARRSSRPYRRASLSSSRRRPCARGPSRRPYFSPKKKKKEHAVIPRLTKHQLSSLYKIHSTQQPSAIPIFRVRVIVCVSSATAYYSSLWNERHHLTQHKPYVCSSSSLHRSVTANDSQSLRALLRLRWIWIVYSTSCFFSFSFLAPVRHGILLVGASRCVHTKLAGIFLCHLDAKKIAIYYIKNYSFTLSFVHYQHDLLFFQKCKRITR